MRKKIVSAKGLQKLYLEILVLNPPYPFVLSLLFRVKAKGTKFFVVRAVWRVISGQSVGKTIIILTLRIES